MWTKVNAGRKHGLLAVALIVGLAGCQPSTPRAQTAAPSPIALAATTQPAAGPSPYPAETARARVLATATAAPRPPQLTPPSTLTQVPTRVMALGIRLSLPLRSAPAPSAATAAVVPGSTVLWADGRSGDSRWLHVVYDDAGSQAWVAGGDVTLFGETSSLPIVSATAATAPPGTPRATTTVIVTVGGRVVGDTLNVRAGPGLDQPVISQLVAGQAVTVTGRSAEGAWFRLNGASADGWVASRYVQVTGNPTTLPALIAASSSPVQIAAGPALPGKLAFQTASGGDIYIVNADGSGLRQIARGLDPALSPDGTRLAYASWETNHEGIFAIDLQTGQEKQISPARRPRSPSWSPDGSYIVFSNFIRTVTCYLTPLGCLEEKAFRKLTGGGDCLETQMGRFCLGDFPVQKTDETGVVQLTVASGAWQDLPAIIPAQSPQRHPKTGEIVYRIPDGLQITAPGGNTRPLVKANPRINSPAWSPDGEHLAVQIYQHDHNDLFLLDGAGNTQAALTTRPPLSTRPINNVSPAWSPDGRYIAFLSDRDGSWRLYYMKADGSGQALLLPAVLARFTLRYDFAAERLVSWSR